MFLSLHSDTVVTFIFHNISGPFPVSSLRKTDKMMSWNVLFVIVQQQKSLMLIGILIFITIHRVLESRRVKIPNFLISAKVAKMHDHKMLGKPIKNHQKQNKTTHCSRPNIPPNVMKYVNMLNI